MGKFMKSLPVFFFSFMKILVKHLLPGLAVYQCCLCDHAVEVEYDRIEKSFFHLLFIKQKTSNILLPEF